MSFRHILTYKWCFACVLILLPWMIFLTYYLVPGTPVSLVKQPLFNKPCPPIQSGTRLRQDFIVPEIPISELQLLFGTYCRQNVGELAGIVEIHNPNGPETRRFTIHLEDLADNHWYGVLFDPPMTGTAGSHGYFEIRGKRIEPGNEVTIWRTDYDAFSGGTLKINMSDTQGDLAFQLTGYFRGIRAAQHFLAQWNMHKPKKWTHPFWLLIPGLLLAISLVTGVYHLVRCHE